MKYVRPQKFPEMTRLFLMLAVALTAAGYSYGQASKRDRTAIEHTKRLKVSRIEAGMPNTRLDTWLRRVFGSGKLSWEVNDCGEQSGTSADKGRDFPMCVEATIASSDLAATVILGVGTFKTGISRQPPDLRGIRIDREGKEATEFRSLKELERQLRAITAL